MRHQGKITRWKDDQGFGFITQNGGAQQVFVHISSFSNQRRRPTGNELVSYEVSTDNKGRARAERVAFVGERPASASTAGMGNIPPALAAGFLLLLAGATFTGRLPPVVAEYYGITSIGTFIAYALDKSAARNDRWRTPESTLHLCALFGGWLGALAAQRWLRHKSRKPSFQFVFWATVAFNCAALGWLTASAEAAALRTLLGGA
jgi:uncharacterized membrane protein YsdA (DUF1294 family)/cold shock CspA family protein